MRKHGFLFDCLVGLAVLALILGLFFGFGGAGRVGAASDLTTSASLLPTAPADPGDVPADAPAPVETHFAIDPAQSSAKLLVTETVLFSDSVVTANATSVSGDVFLGSAGELGPSQSVVRLDLRSFSSRDSFLDSFLKSDTFNARQFPFAEFVMASTSGIPATYADGKEFSFTTTGPLTMRGITRQVTFTAKGRQSGNYLSVVADTDFRMTDFGITPPDYGIGKAKNTVHLQVLFVAARAE